jgi:hypothetical protein
LPRRAALQLRYGAIADELVVRFDQLRHRGEFVVPIMTPVEDYAGLLVDGADGHVVGVHVYPVAAYAVKQHPTWREAIGSDPRPEVAERIVRDIKALYDRYGIDTDPDDPDR